MYLRGKSLQGMLFYVSYFLQHHQLQNGRGINDGIFLVFMGEIKDTC